MKNWNWKKIFACVLIVCMGAWFGVRFGQAVTYTKPTYTKQHWDRTLNATIDSIAADVTTLYSQLAALGTTVANWVTTVQTPVLIETTPIFVNDHQFTLTGDYTAVLPTGKRVLIDNGQDPAVGNTVLSSSYSSPNTTVTVTYNNITGNLQAVSYYATRSGTLTYGSGDVVASEYGSPSWANLQAAVSVANASGRRLVLTPGTWLVSDDLTITAPVKRVPTAIFQVATTKTLVMGGHYEGGVDRGFSLVGTGAVTLPNSSTTYPEEWYSGSGTWESAISSAFNSGAGEVVVNSGTYSCTNTSALTISASNVRILCSPNANLQPTGDADFIEVTGINITWIGGKITGTGNYEITTTGGKPISLFRINGDGLSERQNCTVKGLKIYEPYKAGISTYRSVGDRLEDCYVYSSNTPGGVFTNVQYFNYFVYSSAYIDIEKCTSYGGFEGICGGATDSYTFDAYDGKGASKNTRYINMDKCKIQEYGDNGIYFSSDTLSVKVTKCDVIGALLSNTGIKLCEYGSFIDNNYVYSQGNCIYLRNGAESHISNNELISDDDNANGFIIGIAADADVDFDLTNNFITNNRMSCTNDNGHGIYVYALYNATTTAQNIIDGLIISGNIIKGCGGYAGAGSIPSVIRVYQQTKTGDVANSLFAKNIVISGNALQAAYNGSGNVPCISLASCIDGAVIESNVCTNYRGTGIDIQGAKNSVVSGNTVRPNGGSGTNYGIAFTAVASITGGYNTVGVNNITGLNTSLYSRLVEETSSYIANRNYYNSSLGGNLTFYGYELYSTITANPTAARSITINDASAKFPTNFIMTVSNISGSYALTWIAAGTPGTDITIATNTTKRIIHTGSNSWIVLP